MHKRLFFLLTLLSLGTSSLAQNYLSLEPSYGQQLIFEDNDSLVHDHLGGFDLSYGKAVTEKDGDWVKFFHAKYIQYSFIYLDLTQLHGFYDPKPSNFTASYLPNGIGHHYGLISSIAIQIVQVKDAFHLYFLPGFGLSYLSSTYFTDPANRFIGSHINYTIRFELAAEQKLSKQLALTAAFRGMHFSNGGYQVPQAGVNSFGYKLGLAWKIPSKK